MSKLPVNHLSPEQQQKVLGQLYQLMDRQVKSYHKHCHMGVNSSVPMELAQELMESIEFTTNQVGGIYGHPNLEEALFLGQEILQNKLEQAKTMLELVSATAPSWQTECRWEAFRYLRHYLEQYDWQHLAHRGPDGLFYPILTAPPESIRGIDSCLFHLRILWIENQIMAGFPEEILEDFWDRLPAATLNQCEPLLLNCLGKALLDSGIHEVLLKPEEHLCLSALLPCVTEETLYAAADRLCRWLGITDENAKAYVHAVIPPLLHGKDSSNYHWSALFL